MAKIYSVPKSINVPQLVVNGKFDYKDYQERVNKFYEELAAVLKKHNPDGECVGEVIQFPVADSYAFYMVVGLKPVELVHLPIMDGWDFSTQTVLPQKTSEKKLNSKKILKNCLGGSNFPSFLNICFIISYNQKE